MKNKNIFSMLIVLTVLFGATEVFAQSSMSIVVDSVQKYFRAGEKPIKSVRISNVDPKNKDYAVRVLVQEAIYNEEKDEWEKSPSKDLLVSPKQMILKSGTSRILRLVNKNPASNKEKVYSLTFKPKLYSEDAPWTDVDAKGVEMGMGFVVTSGMLVTVSPANPVSNIEWERDYEGITFKNTGNTRIDLRRRVSYCYEDGACMALPGVKIHAGKTWRFKVDGSIPIKWFYSVYNEVQPNVLEINAVN